MGGRILTALYVILGIILMALGIIFFSTLKFETEVFADLKGYCIHLKFSHLAISVETNKQSEFESKKVTISVFGIKFHHTFKNIDKVKDQVEKDVDVPEEDAETTGFEALKSYFDIFFKIRDDIFKTLSYFSNQLVFNKLYTTIQVGFDDAAVTALAAGLCYTALSPVLGFIFNNFRVKNTNTDVKARYNESVLSVQTELLLTMRPYCLIILIGKAIAIMYKIQKIYKNIKER